VIVAVLGFLLWRAAPELRHYAINAVEYLLEIMKAAS